MRMTHVLQTERVITINIPFVSMLKNILSSRVDPKVNDEFAAWLQQTYGEIKDVATMRKKKHEFLGMELDFSEEGVCHVRQDIHVQVLLTRGPKLLRRLIWFPLRLCWTWLRKVAG